MIVTLRQKLVKGLTVGGESLDKETGHPKQLGTSYTSPDNEKHSCEAQKRDAQKRFCPILHIWLLSGPENKFSRLAYLCVQRPADYSHNRQVAYPFKSTQCTPRPWRQSATSGLQLNSSGYEDQLFRFSARQLFNTEPMASYCQTLALRVAKICVKAHALPEPSHKSWTSFNNV